ncbi:hypothetical protein LR48_Vigan07g281900 [Vigna angularis]|uniref:WAT1-related protein n=1 Tax=Phaseolus angularis TaxID=3914 RepID=A0A0L9V1X2_PHAAN|nr:hypothetical protein LR48_Vigan07g281900 [Vigna angularis]
MADLGSASSRRMWCSIPERMQLHVAMLALQFGYAGFHVVSRAALNMGVSKLVFPVYRNIIALLLLLPFAYFLEKKERPAISLNFACQFFFLALVGPATRVNSMNSNTITTVFDFGTLSLGDAKGKNWTLGCLYLIGHCLSWSGWLVLQAPVLKKYPARLSFTSYTCFFGLLQFLVIALVLERDAQAWLFHSGGEAFTILYAGVVASGIAFAVQIWCIERGGPVFVAVYQPVQTFVVAIMATIALGEEFYLGGIIGAVLIVAGLYFVLWGKSEERKFAREQLAIASTTDHSIIRPASHAKASLAQPLLSSTTENV